MDPNQFTYIENFVEGMVELSKKLKEFAPDHIIAPMIGAIPFVDVISIVDEEFENSKVYYVPASNKIKEVKSVIRGWFKNFLDENYHSGNIRFASLDEVISGDSLVRVYKQAQSAIQSKASQEMLDELRQYHSPEEIDSLESKVKQRLREEKAGKITYFPFGIVDEGKRRQKGKPFVKTYQKMIEEGKTASVSVECIPTMDRKEFFPVTYRPVSGVSYQFYPVVEQFSVSPAYINFLKTVAAIVGKNPENVTLGNMGKILGSSRFLSERHKNDY